MTRTVVAFSGGKDSTALLLRLHELGESFEVIHTATGNEMPEVEEHIERTLSLCGATLLHLPSPTLGEVIEDMHCLPNHRMRWCTRILKIEPVEKWFLSLPKDENIDYCVGLRADEPGRVGLYDTTASVVSRYPLREWGWGLEDVRCYLDRRGVIVPKRTDCAVCFFQTLYEWFILWSEYPDLYAEGIAWEDYVGKTLRSPSRDTHAASMRGLAKEFEAGYRPKPRRHRSTMCRICSM